ncbi:hypothetical protein [Faucicola boevrei]|uniref:hypothetical protein n=1 Tax=Faucicola boevrei TaxID=346665 RepID=UPI00035DC8E8|nr:hypothetical protein [Moraxella boevrei]
MDTVLQYYLKCQHVETGQVLTYRFGNEQDLLNFSKLVNKHHLSIIDSHIVFYEMDLLFNPFDDEKKINGGDINMALDGRVQVDEWLK